MPASDDFNGDGISDIVLRNSATGDISLWELNASGTVVASGIIGNPGSGWAYAGSGDFNADGDADLLFRRSDGAVQIWEMNGLTLNTSAYLTGPGAAWTAVAVGDFNGDARSDILFRNGETNAYKVWNMNGTTHFDAGSIAAPADDFLFAGVADLSQDGKADIVFRQGSGYWAWTLDNSAVLRREPIRAFDGARFLGFGDFNDDGRTDMLFDDRGRYATWKLDAHRIIGGGDISVPGPLDWQALALYDSPFITSGEYTGDGYSDILTQLEDGALVIKAIDNLTVIGSTTIGFAGANQQIVTNTALRGHYASLIFQDASKLFNPAWLVGNDQILTTGSATQVAQSDANPIVSITNTHNGNTDYLVTFPGNPGAFTLVSSSASGEGTFTASGNPGSMWSAIGLGDFNGDAISDVLFRNDTTGVYASWDSGVLGSGGGAIGTAAGFTFAASGDFDGDGKADILFRETATGDLWTWQLNDAAIVGGGRIGNPGGTWQIEGTGDFNGDGKADILFQDAGGNYAIWDIDGTAIIGGGAIGNPAGTWQSAKIIDLNQDAKADIVFVDASGHLASWLMSDTTIIGGSLLGTVPAGSHLL